MAAIQARKGKKGTTYKVEFMRGGSRISKTFKIKKDAQKFAASLLVDDSFSHALTNHTLNTLTLSQAVEMYLQQDNGKDPSKIQRLTYWVQLYGDKPVGKITRQQIRTELKALITSGRSQPTANRYKAALGALYSYLTQEFDIDYSPVKGIAQFEENSGRTRFLTVKEINSLLSATKQSSWDRLYLLVLMAITTGARRTELLTLDWTNIDFKTRTAHLTQTKNGEQRVLTLTQDVVSELMKFRQVSGFLFPHEHNACGYFKVFDFHWRAALTQARIKNFRFHDLRHTCASLLAMNGASLLEIAQVLGHKSITMTQRYSHLCTEHKASLTDRVFGGIAHG
jgi:integrase